MFIFVVRKRKFEYYSPVGPVFDTHAHKLCTCHRLAPGVGPRANQGDCKMVGVKLRIFPRGGGI